MIEHGSQYMTQHGTLAVGEHEMRLVVSGGTCYYACTCGVCGLRRRTATKARDDRLAHAAAVREAAAA